MSPKRRVKYTHTGVHTGIVYTVVRWNFPDGEVSFSWEYHHGLDVVSKDDFGSPQDVLADIQRREAILASDGTVLI